VTRRDMAQGSVVMTHALRTATKPQRFGNYPKRCPQRGLFLYATDPVV
jgi:hypothetical protein